MYSVRVCISLYVLYLDYDSRMIILGQLIVVCSGNEQYNVRGKPTVILYTYINRHAETSDKKQKQNNVAVHHQTW